MTEIGKAPVVLTGAAGGLGRHLALEARRRGHRVYLVDISPEVAYVAAEVGGDYLVADLAEHDALIRIADWAKDAGVLINNASTGSKRPFHLTGVDETEKTIRVNVLAPAILSQIFLARFRQRGSGVIINISSSACYFPAPNLATYGASKAFLTSLSESLVVETLDSPSIRVLAICPSGMDTGFQEKIGVRRGLEGLLLDPRVVARKIFDDLASRPSGIRDYGLPTFGVRVLRSLLPRRIYWRVTGYLMRRYR